MSDFTKALVVNPLASSSSQVAGTRALGIIIEPEEDMVASGVKAQNADAFPNDEVPGPAEAVTQLEVELFTTQANSLAQSDAIAEIQRNATDMAEGLHLAAQNGVARTEAAYEGTLHVFEQASTTMKSALDEAGTSTTMLAFKLVEFAQANARNTLDLARDYASVRTLPDAINAQAAYVRRQFDLLSEQTRELGQLIPNSG